MVLFSKNFGDLQSTGYSPWLTFYFGHSMRTNRCCCQNSEVNSELATTPIGEISKTEEGRKRAERDTDADTTTLASCQGPRKPEKNKKRKTKKRKINEIRNPALETHGSVFEESNDDAVSPPKCGHYSHYQQKCSQSEKFQRGNGYEECGKSHGEFELDPEFIRGKAEAIKLSQKLLGLEFVQAIFELDAGPATEIFSSVCIYLLTFSKKNPKSKLCLLDLGFLHGALEELEILAEGYFNRRRED